MAPFASLLLPSQTETAVANGDTRTLTLYHVHTKETTTVTFRVNGTYDPAALEKLNWALRDWRRNEPTKMDPRLFDVVWEVYREAGSNQPLNILCGYRSPETNAMLRRRSRGVAEFSQHMLGKAMDVSMPDMSMQKVRDIAMRLQRGGVGYYPTSGTPFVHIDVGSVRYWPRISREEMARIFPDGKTVDIPADGRPMPRYQEALAEIEARGGSAYSATAAASGSGKNFLAMLFGSAEEEDGAAPAPPAGARRSVAAPAAVSPGPQGASQTSQVASNWHLPFGLFAPSNAPASNAGSTAAQPNGKSDGTGKLVLVAQADSTRMTDGSSRSDATPIPMPPRRPAALIVADLADVPIPPVRPSDLALIDEARNVDGAGTTTVARMIADSRPSAPTQNVPLPAVITDGTARPSDGPALAFAEVPDVPRAAAGLKVNVLPPHAAAPPRRAKPVLVAARVDRANFRALTASVPTAAATVYAALGCGSAMSPLRSAARSAEASFFDTSVMMAMHFAPESRAVTADRFSGSALELVSADDGLDPFLTGSARAGVE